MSNPKVESESSQLAPTLSQQLAPTESTALVSTEALPKISQTDPWAGLNRFTPARIAIGRTGGSWRTQSLLEFRLAHARARDAVRQSLELTTLAAQIEALGLSSVSLTTKALSRSVFLQRPDLGRALADESVEKLTSHTADWSGRDLAVVVSDGLSALAAERQAVPTLAGLVPALKEAGWSISPIFLIPLARVKIADQVAHLLKPRFTLILLGERPGLGSPDSLGAYFTLHPGPEKTDADRTCISNIRPDGLAPELAGAQLAELMVASARAGCSGVTFQPALELKATLETLKAPRKLSHP